MVADPYWKHFIQSTERLLKWSLFEDPSSWSRAASNMFWALGTLKAQPLLWPHLQDVPEILSDGVVSTAYFMNGQQLANALWATGKLELSQLTNEKVLNALVQWLPDVAEDLKSSELESVFWAAAEHGLAAPQLLEQVPLMTDVLHDKIDILDSLEVAGIILAISKLPSSASRSALREIPSLAARAKAAKVLENMTGQQLANTCWGLAVCGHVDA